MNKKDIFLTSMEISALVGSILFFKKSRTALLKQEKLFKYASRCNVFSVKQLYEIFDNKLLQTAEKELHKFKRDSLTLSFKGFIKGNINTLKPKRSIISNKKNLVIKILKNQPIYSNYL